MLRHEFSLKIDCGLLELIKLFAFKHLPDIFFALVGISSDKFSLLSIESVVEARERGSV